MNPRKLGAATLVAATLCSGPAAAGDWPLGLELEGSFAEGGFTEYRPPITNPVFNETPFITTEARPLYAYHNIPDKFLTNGGSINVVGMQLRLALTERLGFLATTDGYTWIDFDRGLKDDDGFNDLAFGLKYAVISDPDAGVIVTPGLRYVVPFGTLSSGGLDFNGHAGGYLNPFVSAAKQGEDYQIQGLIGAQISLSDDGTSTFLAAFHADYEVLPGLYPLLELNLFVPVDGGDQIPSGPLSKLVGGDIIDLATGDPETVLLVGGGVRYRLTDHVVFGAAMDVNVLQDANHGHGWRMTTDLVIHF